MLHPEARRNRDLVGHKETVLKEQRVGVGRAQGVFAQASRLCLRARLAGSGRDINELLRLFDALQFHEKHGEVCPANWNKGKAGMVASPEGVARFLSDNITDLV